ncbi:MAG: hypothetical protein QM780_01370 [Hyphomicrobium sp.]|uniref:hypothetical protein n=1 Tax=Hyphomicrobium sp. TaxID=82 RepID=UPI0039E549DF
MATFCSAWVRERRTRLWTIGSILLASIVTAGLSGCGSTPNILGGGTPSSQTSLAIPTSPSASPTQSAKLQIAPVIGSPENVARDMQSQLASAIGREGLTVVTAGNETGEYVVRGYVVAAREKSKAKISYIWDVTDQSGKRVHRVTGEEVVPGAGKDPWSAVTPAVIGRISDKTSKQITSWIATGGSVPVASNINTQSTNVAANAPPPKPSSIATASTEPAAPTTGSITSSGPVSAVVPLVTGAPGDGSSTLTSAIQRELSKNGLKLSTVPDSQAYKVVGKVAMGASKDGKQPIQIDWNVIDPSGKKLGTVSQKNEVPTGSLDGAWGKTADAAAAAAAQGIIKLLPAKSVE